MANHNDGNISTDLNLKRIEDTFCTQYRKKIYLSPRETPSTLALALEQIITDLPVEDHELLLSFGGVFVNGAPVRDKEIKLLAPVRIECYLPKFDLKHPEKFFPAFNPEWIIYQDEFIVVCWKPKGLPTIPSREQRIYNLKTYLECHLNKKIHMPSRLDMSTCGIVLVSAASRSNAPIQGLYDQHLINKIYHLRTSASLRRDPITVEDPIGKHPLHPVLRTVREDGQSATTHFTTLMKGSSDVAYQSTNLIEARPVTGRTHQIRVHAAHIGIPILGDNFYAGALSPHGLHLMAYSLTFPHPISRIKMEIVAPKSLLPSWAH